MKLIQYNPKLYTPPLKYKKRTYDMVLLLTILEIDESKFLWKSVIITKLKTRSSSTMTEFQVKL